MQSLKQFTELDTLLSSSKENKKNSLSAEQRSIGRMGDTLG